MADGAILAFDIETVPDAQLLRRHYQLADASDEQVIARASAEALDKSDGRSDFLPLVFHRAVAISYVNFNREQLHIGSLAHPDADEKEAVAGFFQLIDEQAPVLVSWNGSGFDLPVLVLRALHHGVSARGFWRGPGDKWRQYSSRFHDAHHDVMDILALRQPRAAAKLADAALACGLPGKMGYDGAQVYQLFTEGRFADISAYCETDALNTFLIWLRLARSSGSMPADYYARHIAQVKEYLAESKAGHLRKFLASWQT